MKLRGVTLGALLAWLCLLCMCSSATPRPPAFGDCEAGCDPVTGTGGSSPIGGSIDAGNGTTTSDASICGIADTTVHAPDALCAPCIVENCCAQDTSCTTGCASLIECNQNCAVGDTICVGGCENTWQVGLVPYQAFVLCVQQSCMNTCPALQQ